MQGTVESDQLYDLQPTRGVNMIVNHKAPVNDSVFFRVAVMYS